MFKIKIFSIGREKNDPFKEQILEYVKRLQHTATLSFIVFPDEKTLISHIDKKSFCICLDEKGLQLSSIEFSKKFTTFLENSKSITFVIGGSEGLSKKIKKENCSFLISLSKMTFPHQLVKLILVEQIYRTFEIKKNSPYSK